MGSCSVDFQHPNLCLGGAVNASWPLLGKLSNGPGNREARLEKSSVVLEGWSV